MRQCFYLLLAVLACTGPTDPPPVPDRLRNEIVFVSDPGVSTLFRMNSDGSDPRPIPLTVLRGVGTATVSPDGEWLAYSDNGEIWVGRVDGSERRNLTNHPAEDQHPAWSPDGTRIAFHSDRAAQPLKWDIFVIDIDGTNVTQVTTHPETDGEPAWSPDGSAIAFRSIRDGGNFEIYVVKLDGSPPVNLTNDPSLDDTPKWSPDGTTIAFRSTRVPPPLAGGLYLMDSDGSNVRQVPLPFVPGNLSWKPDGTRLAVGGAQDDYDIWSVAPDGSGLVNLTNDPSGIELSPVWSR